jgi:histone deacetylase complex regulatory component SIN3
VPQLVIIEFLQVTTLLKDHPDLLNEFIHFLPNGIASRYVAACNRVRRDSTMWLIN